MFIHLKNHIKNKYMFLFFCLWALFIFSNSMLPAQESSDISGGISYKIYELLNLNIDFQLFHTFIRKCAHFIEYAILGVFAGFSFKKEYFWKIFVLCILVSSADESIQLFVEGRSGQISDVLLDSIGSFTGILGRRIFK